MGHYTREGFASRLNVRWQSILPSCLVPPAVKAILQVTSEAADLSASDCSATELCERALLLGYSSLAGVGGNSRHRVVELLNLAADRVCGAMPSGIFSGLTSVGWTIEHLSRMLVSGWEAEGKDADYLENLDKIIIVRLERGRWLAPYDLVAGLVGIGVYFLERLPRKAAARGLHLILGHLEQQAEYSDQGVTWFTPPELLPSHQREMCPTGYYNLGTAHGVPAVAQFLGELVAASIEAERAKVLLNALMSWLLAHRQRSGAVSRYSNWIAPGDTQANLSRVAWCYGDLGIGGLLHHLALRLGREDWLEIAHSLLDGCLARTEDRVRDAGLCHGALGVAHIYNRVHQVGREGRYRDAAQRYYGRGLSMIDYSHRSFLEGSLGQALALISAVFPIEPHWDRRLLLSGRPFLVTGIL